MPKYIKPTQKTKFHVDFTWWLQDKNNLHATLMSHLCDGCREAVEADPAEKIMDWVDPETAQVFQIDQLWHVIRTQCSQDPDFLSDQLPLATAIFRLFIVNNNTPLTPWEIHQRLQKKSSSVILRTLAGRTIYQGIRPVYPLIS